MSEIKLADNYASAQELLDLGEDIVVIELTGTFGVQLLCSPKGRETVQVSFPSEVPQPWGETGDAFFFLMISKEALESVLGVKLVPAGQYTARQIVGGPLDYSGQDG